MGGGGCGGIAQINHTIDKQTAGNREANGPTNGTGFSWGQSPKQPMTKAFNSGNSSNSSGHGQGGTGSSNNGSGNIGGAADSAGQEKNMFIGLLDIFGCVFVLCVCVYLLNCT